MSPTVLFGSMNCDLPGSMTRMKLCVGAPPPRATNCAVAVVVAAPRFWMMIGVTKPKKRRVMFGRKTLFAPAEKPSYDIASARSVTPWCSLTTLTTVDPYDFTTTENCELSAIVESLVGIYAYDVPGDWVTLMRLAHDPAANFYHPAWTAVVPGPLFGELNAAGHPAVRS